MAPFKRRIFAIAIFLVFAAIIMTLLSTTIYRLTWPEISTATIIGPGKLDDEIRMSTSVIPSRADIGDMGLPEEKSEADEVVMKLRRGAYLSLDYAELSLFSRYDMSATVSGYTIREEAHVVSSMPNHGAAKLTFVDYTLNPATGKYDVYFIVDPKIEAFEGFKLDVTFYAKADTEFFRMVPLGAVFYETTDMTRCYIYAVTESQTMWGKTHTIEKIQVSILSSDYQYVAVAFVESEIPNPEMIACNPTRTLHSGDLVRIKGEI